MSGTSVFVYYRIDRNRSQEARAAIADLLDRVNRRASVRGAWMRRRDDETTWMEVYEHVADADAFVVLLEREAEAAGVTRCLEAGAARHVELFVTMP